MSDDAEEALRSLAEQLPLAEVPSEVSERLRASFRDRLPIVSGTLICDTRVGGQLVGARGGGASAWTMSYSADRCDVLLDIVPTAGRLRVTGQLLCPEPTPGAVVRAYLVDDLASAVSTDEVGQFDLSLLQPSVYTLTAITTHDVVELVVDLRSESGERSADRTVETGGS